MINEFRGEYYFLSNYYPCEVKYDGLTFKNSEAAFQASKTLDIELRKEFCNLPPNEAKALGRQIVLREDWEDVKNFNMFYCLLAKFRSNLDLKEKLLNTREEELIEGNTWGDTYWGVCNGIGINRLGILLSIARERLREQDLETEEEEENENED